MKFEKTFQQFEDYAQSFSLREDPENGNYEHIFEIEQYQKSEYNKLNIIFKEEYQSYINQGIYFYGCPFEVYLRTYKNRLDSFIKKHKFEYKFNDNKTSEILFIENELKEKFEYNPYLFIDEDLKAIIDKSIFDRNELLNDKLNKLNKDNSIESENKFPDYCKIGSLFAQGYINKDGKRYNYKEKVTTDYKEYCKLLSDEIENIDKVRQYIQATFNGSGEKNIYASKSKMKKIIDYCKANGLIITDEFNAIYNSLIK